MKQYKKERIMIEISAWTIFISLIITIIYAIV